LVGKAESFERGETLRPSVLIRAIVLALAVAGTLATAAAADAARFLVVYRDDDVPRDAAREIARAGGTLVWSYDRIGVAIADSDDPAFLERLARRERLVSATALDTRRGEHDDDGEGDDGERRAGRRLGELPDQPAADSDTFSGFQWGLRQIRAHEAHAVTGGSPAVLVGHIDSGLQYDHPDLAPNVDLGSSVSCAGGVPDQGLDEATGRYLFDDTVGHGTQTAGLIAADDNGIGIVGVAPNVRLATVKVTTPSGGSQKILPEAAVCAFMWAAERGVDVANVSLGVDRPEPVVPASQVGFFCRSNPADRPVITAVSRAVKYAQRKGVTVVASAGNTGVDLTAPPAGAGCFRMPLGLPGVVGVTSESALRQKTFNSNYGLGEIELTAPGGDPLQPAVPPAVPTPTGQNLTTWSARAVPGPSRTDGGGGYQNQFGTSAAAPYVTGVAALVVSRFGDERRGEARMSPRAVRSILFRTATPIACPPNPYVRVVNAPPPFGGTWTANCFGTDVLNGFFGYGEVNALAAITLAERPPGSEDDDGDDDDEDHEGGHDGGDD
jgi:subtilisin family serine protease